MEENKSLTIFMYPWFGTSHLISYVGAANKLAEKGHKIFLIIPGPKAQSKLQPLNLHRDLIRLCPVSIPRVEGLPPHAETSRDVPLHALHLLYRAMDLTEPAIESLLRETKPDLAFYDHADWLPGLARSLGIKPVCYSTVSPASVGFLFLDGNKVEDFTNGPVGSMRLSKHEARELMWFNNHNAEETRDGFISGKRRLLTALEESDAVGFKTCGETEGPYCEFLEKKLKKPILLAGPIVQIPDSKLDKKWANWLDKHKPKSVIFLAFGSETVLEKDLFQELLLGIEQTGLPFLVALRPPFGAHTIDEALPEGLEARTEERGLVCGDWVPQQLILKHPSVGCFVTHCGYGSLWEGLMIGECQLVAIPNRSDQHANARLVSQVLKIGLEVRRGDEDGSFTKEDVREAVVAVMADGSEVGTEVRKNLEDLRQRLLSEGFQYSYFDGFVKGLISLVMQK